MADVSAGSELYRYSLKECSALDLLYYLCCRRLAARFHCFAGAMKQLAAVMLKAARKELFFQVASTSAAANKKAT